MVSMGRGGPWPLKYSVTGSWNVADGGAQAGGRRTEDQGDVWEELCGTPRCIPALHMPPRQGGTTSTGKPARRTQGRAETTGQKQEMP